MTASLDEHLVGAPDPGAEPAAGGGAEGVQTPFRRFASDFFEDRIATGALVVLALTGVLMWSRLHGHRLLGLGLFTGMFVFALYFMTLTP